MKYEIKTGKVEGTPTEMKEFMAITKKKGEVGNKKGSIRGPYKKKVKYSAWNKTDEKTLMELHRKIPTQVLAKKLGRTYYSVNARIGYLKENGQWKC